MIFATGDCHGGFQRFSRKHFPQQRQMDRDDYMIILGDFG
ncbi:MAG: metallophosphatase, partial [Clostridiales bacterium]|nr:metallophosphatase [Clostridiales bacterium]